MGDEPIMKIKAKSGEGLGEKGGKEQACNP